jgi:SAM-dependent methyltransferase
VEARVIRPSAELLRRITEGLPADDVAEMAVPSYLHPNPALRWMAWRRLEVVAAELERLCRGVVRPRLLDFGCGGGVLFEEMLRHGPELHATDLVLEPARRLVAERGLAVDLIPPDELESRLGTGGLDVIVAAEVLEHVEPLGPTVQRLRRLLRPGGTLLVSLPTENAVYRAGRRLAGFHGHYHHAGAADIDRELRAAGLRRTSRRSIPGPGPLSVYWIARYVDGDVSASRAT